jgi:hypothetical protein
MALIGEMRFLERLQFFNGQRLFASDLQSLEADNRERRWLHNQSLHQPGVGSGFAVVGNKGDREVTIFPGYAIDAVGREIILTENRVIPVPPVADDGEGNPVFYDLTVSYPDDSGLEESETREGVCLKAATGTIRLREEPVFCWVKLSADKQPLDFELKAQVQNGMRILLAQAEIFECQLNSPLSTAQRRNARPPKQPYIACGEASPDNTWQPWPGGPGLEIVVDTSAAKFQATPCYSAHIVGERSFSSIMNPTYFMRLFLSDTVTSFILDGFTSIVNPTPTGFTMRMLMPPIFTYGSTLIINPLGFLSLSWPESMELLKGNGWYVTWMGVEE